MTLTELRYIVAVSRTRHFANAAATCFVSQPTLSVAIKKLEEELGVTIFERHQHEVKVTPIGERIIEQAIAVLEQANTVKLIAEEGKDELHGALRLGVIYTIGPFLLPGFISLLNEQAPELTLLIDEDFTINLAEKLTAGELDLVILSEPFKQAGIDTRFLYSEPFVVVLPQGHPLTAKKSIRAADLINDTLLLLKSGNCFRDQVMDACPACKSDTFSKSTIQKTLEGSSIDTIRQMVAAGSGVTVIPSTAVNSYDNFSGLVQYRPFIRPVPKRDIVLAHRNSYPRKKLVTLISKLIRQCDLPVVTRR
ncbi:MAG: hydrogen peroxide-inducible genes activator [Gammaproteobacteria bacterium]